MEEFEWKLAENTALLQRLIETAKAKLKSRPKPPQSRPPPRSYDESHRVKFAQKNRMQLKIPSSPTDEFQEPITLVPKKISEASEILAETIERSAQRAKYYAFEVEDYATYTKKIAAKRATELAKTKARDRKNKIAEAKNTFYGARPTPKPPDTPGKKIEVKK